MTAARPRTVGRPTFSQRTESSSSASRAARSLRRMASQNPSMISVGRVLVNVSVMRPR
ncbi:Uncharacterised protein [Mycobacteroides abscessus subsp. abscessus]|nr:Uncharacterised protein [Mycobacteroides abscessus subsp. abscessus]